MRYFIFKSCKVVYNSEPTPISNKMILYNEATQYELNEKLDASFGYNPELDVIQYNPSVQNYEFYDMNFVQAHELSHRIDTLDYYSWENEKFVQAIENTREKVYNNRKLIAEWFSEGGKYEDEMALSDIFSALSDGKLNEVLCGGHELEYWLEDRTYASKEIFANITSIEILGYKSKAEFNGILEEIYKAYKEMVR